MIEFLECKNWKSFANTKIFIDSFSVLIGKNASGKSNIVDAFVFLRELANARTINEAVSKVRGGADWLIRKGQTEATLSVSIHDDFNAQDFMYSISIIRSDDKLFDISAEKLLLIRRGIDKIMFETYPYSKKSVSTSAKVYTGNRGMRQREDLNKHVSVLTQLDGKNVAKLVKDVALNVQNHLKSIFVLNPEPQKMHNYIPLSPIISSDGANVAGVLAGMDEPQKNIVENRLSQIVRELPEKELSKVWAEKIGLFGTDAMLYCNEMLSPTNENLLDARGMSDGTLRFIAMIVALLTLPEYSLLIVDEIDNGLHPSRAKYIIDKIKQLGSERHIDVLCSTHNPTFVNCMGIEMIPFISYVKRDNIEGSSGVFLLEEHKDLARMLAFGNVGEMMANNIL